MPSIRWHVVPIGDHEPHVVSVNCHCHPLDDGDVVVHNAFDLRDAHERNGLMHDKKWITIGEET